MRGLHAALLLALCMSCHKGGAPVSSSQEKGSPAAAAPPEKRTSGTAESGAPAPPPVAARNYEAEDYSKGVVKDMRSLDGCGFLVMFPNGSKIEPDKPLPQSFQADNLPVWVKYETNKGSMSICMSGKIVTITDIVRRNE